QGDQARHRGGPDPQDHRQGPRPGSPRLPPRRPHRRSARGDLVANGGAMSRRLLQIVVAIAGLIPLITGLVGRIAGPSLTPDHGAVSVNVDNDFSFYPAFWFGLAVV